MTSLRLDPLSPDCTLIMPFAIGFARNSKARDLAWSRGMIAAEAIQLYATMGSKSKFLSLISYGFNDYLKKEFITWSIYCPRQGIRLVRSVQSALSVGLAAHDERYPAASL